MPKKTRNQPITDLTFEQAFAELEESLALYERGQELSAYCAKLLDEAELKVQQVEAA